MKLIDVERVPIQHGSLIGTVQRRGGRRPVGDAVGRLLELEEQRGLDRPATLRAFADRIAGLRDDVGTLVKTWKQAGVTVAGYGAARSGPTLISQLGLRGVIDFIVDDHPQKVHRYSPGDGIEILPTEELYRRMPAYTVILAWLHAERIIENNRRYLDGGGHFVVLGPTVRVVGARGDVRV
jgi:hypothetical protein